MEGATNRSNSPINPPSAHPTPTQQAKVDIRELHAVNESLKQVGLAFKELKEQKGLTKADRKSQKSELMAREKTLIDEKRGLKKSIVKLMKREVIPERYTMRNDFRNAMKQAKNTEQTIKRQAEEVKKIAKDVSDIAIKDPFIKEKQEQIRSTLYMVSQKQIELSENAKKIQDKMEQGAKDAGNVAAAIKKIITINFFRRVFGNISTKEISQLYHEEPTKSGEKEERGLLSDIEKKQEFETSELASAEKILIGHSAYSNDIKEESETLRNNFIDYIDASKKLSKIESELSRKDIELKKSERNIDKKLDKAQKNFESVGWFSKGAEGARRRFRGDARKATAEQDLIKYTNERLENNRQRFILSKSLSDLFAMKFEFSKNLIDDLSHFKKNVLSERKNSEDAEKFADSQRALLKTLKDVPAKFYAINTQAPGIVGKEIVRKLKEIKNTPQYLSPLAIPEDLRDDADAVLKAKLAALEAKAKKQDV